MKAENELFKEYFKTHDKKIRDELVDRYTYIAKILAYRMRSKGVDYDDLYQVACMGIVLAIDRFDPDRGIEFATFATPTVMGELKKFLRDKVHLIRMPRKLYDILSRAESIKRENENISLQELSKKLNIPTELLHEAYSAGDSNFIKSLDGEIFSDFDTSLSGFVGYDDNGFALVENRDFIDYCLSQLSDKEQALFKHRFLDGKTQTETAKMMNLSQMSVSRLEKKVVAKIKNILEMS